MAGTAPGGSREVLKYLHEYLDEHFQTLHTRRQALQPTAPVFALEHDLNQDDLDLLSNAVRGAVAEGFDIRHRTWWLPFVVYAAEIGYLYTGDEYWPLFSQKTPGWERGPQWKIGNNRKRIKQWFQQFATEYGGIEPKGAFAENFSIIAWPITHAIMPADLQRQMAQLLYEARAILTSSMLDDPHMLGICLASRTGGYSDRFQKFCSNQILLGHIAAALLSGDDEESPYLVQSALVRLLDDLTDEHESRDWLHQAKRSAHTVRSSGFLPTSTSSGSAQRGKPLSAVSNPKLLLRQEAGGWRPYLDLPDLTTLQAEHNQVGEELRKLRPKIEGRHQPLPRGKLLYPGRVPLTAWPRPGVPIIQLEQGSAQVNELIAERCAITRGPWWLFRKHPGGLAIELKGGVVRPGHEYCLAGRTELSPPALPWVSETVILADGVSAFDVQVPHTLSEEEITHLAAAGLSVVSNVSIHPVGIIPASWDGEGAAEWMAGEPALLTVSSTQATEKCSVRVDGGQPYLLEWPAGSQRLVFALEDLSVGTHEVHVALLTGGTGKPFVSGSLAVTIRDPHPNLEEATEGAGIRLFATPARPKLTEIWDGRASLSADGPVGTRAELTIVLRDEADRELARQRHLISLPFDDSAWMRLTAQEFRKGNLQSAYNAAESCEVSVSRSGVGFASLSCERGFHPLRWVLTKQRNGGHTARLIDRTDGDGTQVLLFSVENPLLGEQQDARRPITAPAGGGMLRATSGHATAAIILPPDPNWLRQRPSDRPTIRCTDTPMSDVLKLIRGHHRWQDADLSANPFSYRQWQLVLDAITAALVSLTAGNRWAHLERRHSRLSAHRRPDMLDEMQKLVGEAPAQRAVARYIAGHLWQWGDSMPALREGLSEAIGSIAADTGIGDPRVAAEFLLLLASTPGSLESWDETEREKMLRCVLISPVLIRAARFAILATEDLREAPDQSTIGGTR
ncbi:hypothetical protein [Streptomyces alkaliphilus]|uniref:Uncharacterized protein n=1 Tax=Streptomyces alkaliphilus TaxID=1472722 RepID=A0A646I9A7_9ACTN|nr:hypothetical protein [Streptomyces alkaliphilus]MQS06204.1 hypothetical protein [Streptomyces alkaliphilus]